VSEIEDIIACAIRDKDWRQGLHPGPLPSQGHAQHVISELSAAGYAIVHQDATGPMLAAAYDCCESVGVTTKQPSVLGLEIWCAMLNARPR
jgi:hypothetical protein